MMKNCPCNFEQWINWSFKKYGDGQNEINRHQMKLAVISLTGQKPKLPKGKTNFNLQDLKFIVSNPKMILCDASKVYDEIDVEQKGYVTKADLLNANRKSDSKIDEEILISAFERVDSDHDDKIPFNEFISVAKNGLLELGFNV